MLASHREKKKHFYGAKIRILSVIAYCSLCFSFFSLPSTIFSREKVMEQRIVFFFFGESFSDYAKRN